MSSKNAVQSIERTVLDASELVGAYLPINELGFTRSCFMIRIVNRNKSDILLSFDGVTDHEYVRADEVLNIIIPPDSRSKVNFAKGTIIYASAAFAVGYIYLSGYYRDPSF